MRRKNAIILVATVIVAVLAASIGGFTLFMNNSVEKEDVAKEEMGNVIDFPIKLVTDDGVKEIMVSELYEPGKITILEFTFIGCASCEYLHNVGYLQEIYSKYQDKIEIVSIFVQNEEPDWIREYRDQFKINWKYMALGEGDLIIELSIPTLFTHIFVDENGVERFRNPAQIQFVKDNYPKIIELILNKEYDKLKEFEGGAVIEAG